MKFIYIRLCRHLIVVVRLLLVVVCLQLQSYNATAQAAFVHPGMPLSTADLVALKAHVQAGEYPWKQAYDLLAADSRSSLSYTMQGPFASVSRNPHINRNQWMNDMTAVWNLSLMWYFTGNAAYATKSRDILIAWANTQTEFVGIEANLDLGDFAYAYGGAASILRGTWPGWTPANTAAVKQLFNNVYWPATGCDGYALGPANKGALSIVAGAAIAIFSDNQAMVDKVVYLFRHSASSGLPNTLPNGQIGESARDQGHANGTLVSYAMAAEMLWKQGIDLYSELDNRLLAAGEYFARKNEGVPQGYITYGTTDWLYLTDETDIWDGGRMTYMLLHGAYGVRKGIQTPYIGKRIAALGRVGAQDSWFLKTSDNSVATIPPDGAALAPASLAGTGLDGIDIGNAFPAGSSSFSNNVWTVSGGGRDLWTHNRDSLHFVYKAITGNCTIIAKVDDIGSAVSGAKAGVMIRSDLTDNAAQRVWAAITPLQKGEAFMHGWTEVRGGANWEKQSRPIPQMSYWVKIERVGDVIATYYSPDGASWAVETEGRFAGFPATAYVGLAVSSGTNGTSITSSFSNVSITGGAGGITTTPQAPYSIHAAGGNAQVQVRWLSSFGAAGYNLKRSASLYGTYATIAENIQQNSYVDNAVANGQTYFYKVAAVNAAGESADSPADSATARAAYVYEPLDGMFKIVAKHSNKVLGVRAAATTDGALIEQNTYTAGGNQHWNVTHLGNGDYKIINALSGKALDVVGNSVANGAALEQRTYAATDNSQVWRVFDRGNKTYNLIGKPSQKAADIPSASTANGAGATLYNWSDGSNQVYRFEPVTAQDLFAALRSKIVEAIHWRDSTLTTTSGELGKYPAIANAQLNDSLLYVQTNFDSLTTTFDEAGLYISLLSNAINRYKLAYLYQTNGLPDGIYYMRNKTNEFLWTRNSTNSPSFEMKDTASYLLQGWQFVKEGNGRYKITHVGNAPSPYQNYINESAQFGTNSYLPAWNSLNIYYNGSGYALQRAQSAGNGYWYISGNKILAVSGNANDPFPYSFPFDIVPAPNSQTIAIQPVGAKMVGDTAFKIQADASSGLPVTLFTSSDTTVAIVANNWVQVLKKGTAVITATQAGNGFYAAAAASVLLDVHGRPQQLTFDSISPKLIGDTAFTLVATSNQGLPVSFSSSDTTIASIADGKLHMLRPGTVVITAYQPGNDEFVEAAVARQLVISGLGTSLQYADGDAGNTTNNAVRPYLKLLNAGALPVQLAELEVRYWLTAENYTGMVNAWVDYAEMGNSKINMLYVDGETRQNALGYMRYSFSAAAGWLQAGTNTGVMQTRFANSDWSALNEADDYSYRPGTTYAANPNITVYRNGVLVWGTEPAAIEPVLVVKAFSQSKSSGANTVSTTLQLQNSGSLPVYYAGLKVRYWFTSEGASALNFWADYAKIGANAVFGRFVSLPAPHDSADTYLELSFAPSLGTLQALAGTGNIDYRISKQDWGAFSQLNDYSYRLPAAIAENAKVTVYYQDSLIYGVEPTLLPEAPLFMAAAPAPQAEAIVSKAVLYPNPAKGSLYLVPAWKKGAGRSSFGVRITNAAGKQVHFQKVEGFGGGSVSIAPSEHLVPGLYWVQVDSEALLPLIIK